MQVDELQRALEARGIDNAEELLGAIDRSAAEGALHWWDDQHTLGRKIGPGLLAAKLREGGIAGYESTTATEPRPVDPNLAWARKHLPEIPEPYVVGAFLSMKHALRRDPTADEVVARINENIASGRRAGPNEWYELSEPDRRRAAARLRGMSKVTAA